MLYGLLDLSFWGYIIATLLLTHITIASVTIYLHRHQSHRALELHPIISHFFRFWLWMTTGMVTREWVSIHRKHHAYTEKKGDPHSPVVFGVKKVLLEGAELYRDQAKNQEALEKYTYGTPNDWIERNVYSKYPALGVSLLLIINLILFGLPGISIWAIQMIWIPFFAAGVINGIGHYWGYRNFECHDASRNVIPFGILIGGEELHNNHHTYASSAKLSVKWWEFDIGWMYIRLLSLVGLAKVKKLPPKIALSNSKVAIDADTIKAIFSNRFQVMSHYYKDVVTPVFNQERQRACSTSKAMFSRAKKLLVCELSIMDQASKQRLKTLLEHQKTLELIYQFRLNLQAVWSRTTASQKELIEGLQQWCKQAEASGIEVLIQFAQSLPYYVPHKGRA